MAEITENENKNTKPLNLSPLEGEGLRGDGTPKWYIVHTYSGYENKVQESIERMVAYRGIEDLILEVAIPTETVVEKNKKNERKERQRKIFPGYVVIKMIVNNDTWYLVRNTEGVTGFVGNGSDPTPLTTEEAVRMGVEKADIDLDVAVGDKIRITGGPFEGTIGTVEEVNPEKQIVKVKTAMFAGRDTTMEVKFPWVTKAGK